MYDKPRDRTPLAKNTVNFEEPPEQYYFAFHLVLGMKEVDLRIRHQLGQNHQEKEIRHLKRPLLVRESPL